MTKIFVKAKNGCTCPIPGQGLIVSDTISIEVPLTIDVQRLLADGSLIKQKREAKEAKS